MNVSRTTSNGPLALLARLAAGALVAATVAACAATSVPGDSGAPPSAEPTLLGSPTSDSTDSLPSADADTPGASVSLGPIPTLPAVSTGDWTGIEWVAGPAPAAATTPNDPEDTYSLFSWSGGYVGFRTTVDTSPDAAPWTITTTSSVSPDGLRWQDGGRLESDYSGIYVDGLVESPDGLVAVGRPMGALMCACYTRKSVSAMWTSKDGLHWTPIDMKSAFGFSQTSVSGVVFDVVAGTSGYVAVGTTVPVAAGVPDEGIPASASIWLSDDGRSWRQVALPQTMFKDVYFAQAIAFGGAYFVAGSIGWPETDTDEGDEYATTTPALWRSTDGTTWQRVALSGMTAGPVSVLSLTAIAGQTLVATISGQDPVGSTRPVWVTSDGIAWTRTTAKSNNASILTHGRRSLLLPSTLGPRSEPDIAALDPQLHPSSLSQTGDRPLDLWASGTWVAALGPTGLVVTDQFGTRMWVGVPTGH